MGDFVDEFTVYALFYGDYPELAERSLGSLCKLFPPGGHLRLALNECSERTYEVVNRILGEGHRFTSAQAFLSATNIHKYPMMRRMVHQQGNEISTRYAMWFDDDSYLVPPGGVSWLARVHQQMQSVDMLGSINMTPQAGNQYQWVREQPWFNGQPLGPSHRFVFAVGAWWVIRAEVLKQFNWPPVNLDHCGGDVMLGELFRQHNLRLGAFKDGVMINADLEGNEAMAPRRGFQQNPVGYDFKSTTPDFVERSC